MTGHNSNLVENTVTGISWRTSQHAQTVATLLASTVILTSAIHFWPFEKSKAWQVLCPSNLFVMIWSVILTGYLLQKRGRHKVSLLMSHISVFAYLTINVLSIAFASDVGRAAGFVVKLWLIWVGGYTLLSSAIYNEKSLEIIYGTTVIALIISLCACLMTRFVFHSDSFGFFDNAYKYGTYVGILAPLCGSYLLTSRDFWKITLGAALVIGALVSSGSLGTVLAIIIGMLTTAVIITNRPVKFGILAVLLCGTGLTILLNMNLANSVLRDDIRTVEKDGINLKQRYIEWQADINLLEDRSVTGTGAGCLNEYRSNFYYRLPKLNTLKPFDQNGWLAVASETGILGFVCLCWVIISYGNQGFRQLTIIDWNNFIITHRAAIANVAGFAAACVANIFSSVHYNGILIVFVLLLVLISRADSLSGANKCEYQ
jgi:hypothetical protein